MDRRKFLKVSGGIAGAGMLAGCSGNGGGSGDGSSGGSDGTATSGGSDGGSGDSGGSKEPVTIGAIQPLSGPFTPWGKSHKAGLAYAVKQLNQNGGVLGGRKLKVKTQDTGSDAAKADSAFRKFVEQEDAVAVTGAVSSDVGIRTARTAQDVQVPNLLHMAGSDAVITPETTYTFRVGLLPASTLMQAQAQLVEDKGYSKVGAIVADYAWGQSVKKAIEEYFPIDVNIQVAPVGADDFKPYIRKFDKDIEMLIATGHPPGMFTLVKQLFQLGYSPESIPGASIPPKIIYKALGKDSTKGISHIHNADFYTDKYVEVGTAFGKATGMRFDSNVCYGYVTGQIIAAGIEEAGSADPKAIADALRNMKIDSLFAKPIQWSDHGELKDQVQIYSQLELGAPEYFPDGKFRLTEEFRTDPLPALPPEK